MPRTPKQPKSRNSQEVDLTNLDKKSRRRSAGSQGRQTQAGRPKPRQGGPLSFEDVTWPSSQLPKLNLLPQPEVDRELNRRAKVRSFSAVAAALAVVTGASLVLTAQGAAIQGKVDNEKSKAEASRAYISQNSAALEFYNQLIDQRSAAAEKFAAEMSPSRILSDASPSVDGVKVAQVSFNSETKDCTGQNPLVEGQGIGCVSITGNSTSAASVRAFAEAISKDGSAVVAPTVTKFTGADKKYEFAITAWYTQDAQSGRAAGLAPTQEEIAKVIRKIASPTDYLNAEAK